MCGLIIPADAQSPSAAQLQVHRFIDERVSAPYPDQAQDRPVILDGLAWLEAESAKRFGGKRFDQLHVAQQSQIADDICWTETAKPEFATAARFFQRCRDLTAGGFYTTPEGMKDGAIVVHGPRSHLFYTGPVQQHDFKNFELKIEVMTFPHANSGVYFHTQWQEAGWPERGYEVQVNNSHSDPSRTGGLWGVQDYMKVVVPDQQWFTMTVRVEGKRITTFVNNEKTADYTEESPLVRKEGLEKRYLSSGTFALQGHDPGSETHFRNIRVKVLP